MSRGTDVFYNGVELINCVVRNWDQQLKLDPSGTNAVGNTYSLTFSSIVTGDYINTVAAARGPYVARNAAAATSGSASNVYQSFRELLMAPRGQLIVKMNGTTVLLAEPTTRTASPDRDIANGPKPKSFRIEHVASDRVFRVTWSVEVTGAACVGGSNRLPPVLSNRWSVGETMDANHYTTRTIRGTMVLSSSEINAHAYRHLVTPPLEQGFRRDSISFEVQDDGLAANYQIVDRQIDHAAPWPATKIQASHTLISTNGTNFLREVTVSLEGPPQDRRALIERCIQVADNRLQLARLKGNSQQGPSGYIENAAIVEHFGDTARIDFRMLVREAPQTDAEFISGLSAGNFGRPLSLPDLGGRSYDFQNSFVPPTYGTTPEGPRDPAVLMTLRAYLQTPCGGNKAIGTQSTDGASAGRATSPSRDRTRVQEIRTPKIVGQDNDRKYSREGQSFVYSYSVIRTRFPRQQMKVQLPFSVPVQGHNSYVATLAAPQGQKIVLIDVERAGKVPTLPPPVEESKEAGITYTLLEHYPEVLPPTLSSDGKTQIFRVRGYYKYAMSRPLQGSESVSVGQHGYTDFQGKVSMRDVYGTRSQ